MTMNPKEACALLALETALKPFAEAADKFDPTTEDGFTYSIGDSAEICHPDLGDGAVCTVGDLRRARRARRAAKKALT